MIQVIGDTWGAMGVHMIPLRLATVKAATSFCGTVLPPPLTLLPESVGSPRSPLAANYKWCPPVLGSISRS